MEEKLNQDSETQNPDNQENQINLRNNSAKRSVLSEYMDEDVQKIHKELKEKVQSKRKKEKAESKEMDAEFVKEKLGFKYRMKRWWFGMDKEVKRMTWPTAKQLLTNFLIVIFVVALLTLLFFGINQIFVSAGILN